MAERIAKVEARASSNTHRINTLEKVNTLINEQNKNMAVVLEQLKQISTTQTDHTKRITALEHRPGNLWDKLILAIVGAVGAAIGGGIIALILK